ncbi:gustatory receptor 45 [Nasonia vitripennis]|uniref:Gustatory receptor n=1 Tax=Nasonia vitripennis TaxID=7425 RepID=A0A7M6UWJ7_NASVI|nr:gustatory receptor 45 [Nasonia vitripennis]
MWSIKKNMLFGKQIKKFDYLKLLYYYFKVFGLATMTFVTDSTKTTPNRFGTFSRSKYTIVYNVVIILVFVMPCLYNMTIFCVGTNRVKFEDFADCIQINMALFVTIFILSKFCISSDSLISIANSISRITESLLTLSSISLQKRIKVSFEIKQAFIVNITMWIAFIVINLSEIEPWMKNAVNMYVSNFLVSVLILQYSVILKFLQYDFKILNENLIEFRNEDSMKIRSPTETKAKIDGLLKLQKLHESLSDTSRRVSMFYSYLMLVSVLNIFIMLIFVCYYLAKPIILTHDSNFSSIMLLRCFWYGLLFVVLLVTLTKFVTATIEESRRTKEIISSCLMIPDADEKLLNKLNQFSLYLLHRDVKFTVWGLFTLDESLLTSMAGSITTYMVIVLQFQQKD